MKGTNSHVLKNESPLILAVDDPSAMPWDIETDVLVIGAGGCGLVAALAAAETGAEVFVLEKEKGAGGNTALSQAMISAAGTMAQAASGITDSAQLMAADILKKNNQGSDPDLTLHIAMESARFIAWLQDTAEIELGLVTDFLYPGHSVHRIHANKSRKGRQLVTELLRAVERFPNITIAYNAPAKRLAAHTPDGAVLGAEANIAGIGRNLARAKRTILALNGFGANRDLLARYIPEMSSAYYFGHEGNTGEGILWGQALGARLENMGAYQSHGSVAHPHGTLLTWAVISLGGFQVNLSGERFVNEYHGYSEHALDVLRQEGGVAVEIFDRRIFDAVQDYEDFRQCVQMGAVKQFENIRSLADSFGLPPDRLAQTFEAFQTAARGETADELGRIEFGLPLTPPFYGVKVTGALFHTQGGLGIDSSARVLRTDGSFIPNLYAGGGTAAGFSGKAGPSGYLSANGLMAALILGMIAGETAGRSLTSAIG
jgi:fumarate reductase flavoprotein subunit